MWTRQNDGFYFNKGLKGPNFVYFSSNFDAASFFELIVLRDSCSSCFSSISYGFRDIKLNRKNPTKAEFQNLNFLIFHLILMQFFMPPWQRGGEGHINLPLSVRPDIDTWFVRLSPTVLELQLLILCRIFIHIMELCMSTGFWFSSNILKMTGSWTSSFFSY